MKESGLRDDSSSRYEYLNLAAVPLLGCSICVYVFRFFFSVASQSFMLADSGGVTAYSHKYSFLFKPMPPEADFNTLLTLNEGVL